MRMTYRGSISSPPGIIRVLHINSVTQSMLAAVFASFKPTRVRYADSSLGEPANSACFHIATSADADAVLV